MLLDDLNKIFIKYTKPKPFKDGDKFENYIREVIFPKHLYVKVHKTTPYEENELDFAEDSINPDYIFRPEGSRWKFHVECKFRDITKNMKEIDAVYKKHNIDENKKLSRDLSLQIETELKYFIRIKIYSEKQFKIHKNINETEKVFVCIGLIDQDLEEIKVFLVPISEMVAHFMDLRVLDYYMIPHNYCIIPEKLWDLANNKKDAFCIRCGEGVQLQLIQPLCYKCWSKWYPHLNFKFSERYCHRCKKDSPTSVARPLCPECLKTISF